MSKPRYIIHFNIQNRKKMVSNIKLSCNLGSVCDLGQVT